MKDYRCKFCKKLLAKIEDSIPVQNITDFSRHIKENSPIEETEQRQIDEVVRIKCPKCGTMNGYVKSIKMVRII